MSRIVVLLLIAICLMPIAAVQARQDPAPVRQAVQDWLSVQTQGLPGVASFTLGDLSPDNQLAPCGSFEIGRPAGARAWGRTHVQVRCLDTAGWRINIPVHIRIKTDYLISARPIARGQPITAADLSAQAGDLSELPANVLTDSALAIGKTASASIPAGRPLRADLLKTPLVIRQGQTVRIVSQGPGFAVSNEGRALTNAREGEIAQVRLVNGQVVSGTARADGSVEVGY